MNRGKTENILKKYLAWPIGFALLMIITLVAVLAFKDYAVEIIVVSAVIATVAAIVIYVSFRRGSTKALVSFALDTQDEQNKLIKQLDVPYAIADADGNISWENDAFKESNKNEVKTLNELLPDVEIIYPENDGERKEYRCSMRDRKYNVVIVKTVIDFDDAYAVFLYDETQLSIIREKFYDDKTVVGLIYIDNYDEALNSVDEVKKSLLIALVDRKISKFISDVDGILAKTEKDKYVFAIKNMYLAQLENTRFDILEDVKTVNIGNEISVTLSIGIGRDADTLQDNYIFARSAIDMALARGGDQAVLKDPDSIQYYGGKSQSTEKSTRVKARVKAQAFKEILLSRDRLIIMGHKLMDIDCLGSALGVWRIANALGKKAYIISGETSGNVRQMMERCSGGDYPDDIFIDKAMAMSMADEETVLAVVDVNRPSLTEAPELLDVINDIVVFDHHRQGSDVINQAVLSYIEPYASSSSEMVTEIVQYITDDIKLKPAEADAMYAGIAVDTYNFTNQTGVRTFEAAAFLRKNGADVTRVRKIFRDSVVDYKAKAKAINDAEIFEGCFAIAECDSEGLESPTIIGAQAANELLDIAGIKASIVLTEYRGFVYISARSIDEVNVQVMMEKLGGGGHRSIAGTQLKDISIEDAKNQVKEVILEMIKRGDVK